MASTAHIAWNGAQRARLAELDTAHLSAQRDGCATEQLLWSMTLRLAAEFQEFTRNLHTLAAEEIVAVCGSRSLGVAGILRANFAAKRDLESTNARTESITNDYLRLGFNIWDALRAVHGKQVDSWKAVLADLNETRNAVAHNDLGKFSKLAARGVMPLQIRTLSQWCQELDMLVDAMDVMLSDYLSKLLGINPPW